MDISVINFHLLIYPIVPKNVSESTYFPPDQLDWTVYLWLFLSVYGPHQDLFAPKFKILGLG